MLFLWIEVQWSPEAQIETILLTACCEVPKTPSEEGPKCSSAC